MQCREFFSFRFGFRASGAKSSSSGSSSHITSYAQFRLIVFRNSRMFSTRPVISAEKMHSFAMISPSEILIKIFCVDHTHAVVMTQNVISVWFLSDYFVPTSFRPVFRIVFYEAPDTKNICIFRCFLLIILLCPDPFLIR